MFSHEIVTGETERWSNHAEPIHYDSVTREWARHQSDSQDIASADSLARAVAIISADPHNGQNRGWKRCTIEIDSVREVCHDN